MQLETKSLLIAIGVILGIFIVALLRIVASQVRRTMAEAKEARFRLKSGEVRLGKVSETLAPFLSDFPVDVKKPGTSTVFVGAPVDYIYFDPEEGITFVEVKSGNSRLSPNQRKIRDLVEAGAVHWAEVRIKES